MADWLEVGQRAPAFALQDQDGKSVKLADFRGRPVVVYFYPKDDTPGCTREACAFRDAERTLQRLGAAVVGISADDTASHRDFAAKHRLNFPILADTDHRVAEKYGAWRERNMYGKRFMGIQRCTFLIDGQGIVRRVWKRVQVDGHDAEVLDAIRELAEDS